MAVYTKVESAKTVRAGTAPVLQVFARLSPDSEWIMIETFFGATAQADAQEFANMLEGNEKERSRYIDMATD